MQIELEHEHGDRGAPAQKVNAAAAEAPVAAEAPATVVAPAAAEAPAVELIADAEATVTATARSSSTAEQVLLIQAKLATARALADKADSGGSPIMAQSSACLAQAADAVRDLQATIAQNATAGSATAPTSAPPAAPVSPLEEGQIPCSAVRRAAARVPGAGNAGRDSVHYSGHASNAGVQQPAKQGFSLASAFDDALEEVLQSPASNGSGSANKKLGKNDKKRFKRKAAAEGGQPAESQQSADRWRQTTLQMGATMKGALICGCSGAKLDDCYSRHCFQVPAFLRKKFQRVPEGLPMFLLNNDVHLLLGPFYAKETAGNIEWVSDCHWI